MDLQRTGEAIAGALNHHEALDFFQSVQEILHALEMQSLHFEWHARSRRGRQRLTHRGIL
eukprot:jgi/Botrbrau1/12303/Bobra.0205s0002.1